MKNRLYRVYITPKEGGADRIYDCFALNFGEAEALAAENADIQDVEFISAIYVEFPKDYHKGVTSL